MPYTCQANDSATTLHLKCFSLRLNETRLNYANTVCFFTESNQKKKVGNWLIEDNYTLILGSAASIVNKLEIKKNLEHLFF